MNASLARPPRLRRRLLFWILYLPVLYLLLEGTARSYWVLRWKTPLFRTDNLQHGRFYPELSKSGVLSSTITKDDAYYDILFLGGSVLTNDFGSIEPLLRQRLETGTDRKVRIFNCAGAAMTTRDSLIKYRQLKSPAFDLVFIYEGLNDVRLNNIPPQKFRADYTHNSWYHRLARLDAHPETAWTVLPFTCEYLVISMLDKPAFNLYQPRNRPKGGWKDLGDDVLTAPSVRKNLT